MMVGGRRGVVVGGKGGEGGGCWDTPGTGVGTVGQVGVSRHLKQGYKDIYSPVT